MISYFKRKSQNLSTAIEAIYGLRVSNDSDKSLKLASETFAGMVDFDLDSILKTHPADFVEEIKKLNYSNSYLNTIVNLMLETAAIFTSLNKENEALNLENKALQLLKYLSEHDKTYSEVRTQQMNLLEEKIKRKW